MAIVTPAMSDNCFQLKQQPGMRTVAAKTADQQAMLALHRMRALLVKSRTMQVSQLRGLLHEFGATFRSGRQPGLAQMGARMAELEQAALRDSGGLLQGAAGEDPRREAAVEPRTFKVFKRIDERIIDFYRAIGANEVPTGIVEFLAGDPQLERAPGRVAAVEEVSSSALPLPPTWASLGSDRS